MSLDPGARDPVILMELGDLVQQNALSDVPGSPHCPLVAAPDAAVSTPVVRGDLPKPGGRVLLVGDVHACLAELLALLVLARFDETVDVVVLLGDLVNKGPDSLGVLRWAMAHAMVANNGMTDEMENDAQQQQQQQPATGFVLAIRGNHEDGALLARAQLDAGAPLSHGASFGGWVGGLRAPELAFLRSLPLMLLLPRFDVVCVHAGLLPGVPLPEQPHVVATKLRVMVPVAAAAAGGSDGGGGGGGGGGESRPAWAPFESDWKDRALRVPHEGAVPWWTLWGEHVASDDRLSAGECCPWQASHVVFGHDAVQKLQLGKRATGLDTGCCLGFGGCRLSAMVLGPRVPPEALIARRRRDGCFATERDRPGMIISVPSQQAPLRPHPTPYDAATVAAAGVGGAAGAVGSGGAAGAVGGGGGGGDEKSGQKRRHV
jgi:hypothetical protein